MKISTAIALCLIVFGLKAQNTENDSIKKYELDEIVLKQRKKAIEQKADRTIFDFSEQPQLNSGSLMEGIKKLPGLIVSEVAGMMYQGKQLEVFMDGRPLQIYSNELTSFLEGLPANSIEKVEVITQPGAEFPATSGGAIINIITSQRAKNYISATYSSGASFTDYDKFRSRFNNSLLLNARNKYFGWQLQLGQNYNEALQNTALINLPNSVNTLLSGTHTDRINRSYFLKSGLKINIKNDRLLLNYDQNWNPNTAYVKAEGLGFATEDKSTTKSGRKDALLTYEKRFEDVDKKLEFILNYNQRISDFDFVSRLNQTTGLENVSNQDYYSFKADYSQKIKLLDEGKWSIGTLADKLDFDTQSFGITNLDYTRETLAGYTEFQAKYKKMDFILGGRAENYDITGTTQNGDLIPFKQFKFFPNASAQYNFAPQMYFNMNYNKKIALPNTSALNPNNTNYQNPNVTFGGNPQLQPTIYDNFEVKLSAFDYAFISYNVSQATNQVVTRLNETNNLISSVNENLAEVRVHNFNFGLPVPYMLFTKGLKKTMEFDFNPDEINFLYIYTGYQKHDIPNIQTKGFWMFNLMSQMQLPKKIKFVANYNTNTTGGNYYYFVGNKPFNQSLDLTFSKKFLNDNLSVSIFVNDILNTNNQEYAPVNSNLVYRTNADTRRVGFSLNYKIPTKNKLAKVDSNLLKKDNQEEDNQMVK